MTEVMAYLNEAAAAQPAEPACECAKYIEMWYESTRGYWHREECPMYDKDGQLPIPASSKGGE